jgi:prepilin-type N-terminal cleavage/methylation domain-containing protein
MSLLFKKTRVEWPNVNLGFSLIEVLIALGIFSIIAFSIFLSYSSITDVIGRTRISTLTTSLLNKQIELIRNVPYDNVGIIGGFPPGVIPATSTISYEGQVFLVSAFVRNTDDPFDGKTGGTPNDTAPADYKLVELQLLCTTCGAGAVPLIFTTTVGPQNLETSTKNGSLFINVFDANGQPVSGASVLVKNTSTTPTITINDATNNSGTLQLVDIPTSTNSYQITVSKTGYTTSQTRKPGDPTNPNPTVPHSTVASQLITAMSFAIDRVSTINVQTQDQYCAPVPSVSMTQAGQKLIGSGPNVLNYSQAFTTDSGGASARSGLEWDTYSFTNTDATYDLAGSMPFTPVSINPSTTMALQFLMEPKATSGLLVSVANASGSPVADVNVNIQKAGFTDTKITGEKVYTQTNWAGLQYTAQDGMINDVTPPGQLQIVQPFPGQYATSTNSWLTSKTIDFGTSTTSFRTLSWNPTTQSLGTTLQFQLASSNNAAGPWLYVEPNGTPATFYTTSGGPIGTMHDGNRYLRYQVFMNTIAPAVTPLLTDVAINFASGCIPSGSAFWGTGLGTGTYSVTASKTGYTTATSSVTVGTGWQELKLLLQ